MSYLIEYNRKVYKHQEDGDYEPNYVLLVREGDNNVFEMNGVRVKDWHVIAYGWAYTLWEVIAERAGYTMGGHLQVPDGWDTKWIDICEYIERHRKAIKNAKPIENIFKDFKSIDFVINIRGTKEKTPTDVLEGKPCCGFEIDKSRLDDIKKFMEKHNAKFEEEVDFYGYHNLRLEEPITDVEKLKDALEVWRRLPRWYGPMRSFFLIS